MKLHLIAAICFLLAFVLYVAGFKLGAGLFFLGFVIEGFAWITLGRAANKTNDNVNRQ